jgi:ppGpp synthetase/RelA/SpoT-type nucleotidyltranferase
MKESKLIEMNNKIQSQTRVLQEIINKINMLQTVVSNLLEVTSRLKEYESIANQLKLKSDDKNGNTRETSE